jgi:predicted TIM-barrel fold metal-dependent hydrolase
VIIDAHVHLDKPGPEVDQQELATLLRRADAAGIERLLLAGSIMVAGARPTIEQVRQINDQTMAAVRQQPDRFWGLCYVNPRHDREARTEMLRCVRDGPLCGVKLWVAAGAGDPIMAAVSETAVQLDVAILQHAWDRTSGDEPDMSQSGDVAELAGRYPDLRIQMAHMGGVGWGGINRVADLANVSIDTAGAQPIAGLLEYALERLGPGRIVFGSDYPVREFAVKVATVKAVEMAEPIRRAVMCSNAQRLWGR